MVDRTLICGRCLRLLARRSNPQWRPFHPKHASTAAAITPAPPIDQTMVSTPPITHYPLTQPPSHRPPEFRKSQLHRQYTSLLRSTPLMLLFQHNNLKATEWMAVRRELAQALQSLDDQANANKLSASIKLQIIQSRIFSAALRVVEYWDPSSSSSTSPPTSDPLDPSTPSSVPGIPNTTPSPSAHTHALSRTAHTFASAYENTHPLSPLLVGPVAILTFPTVSPVHLKTALSILSPKAPNFPAPTRRANLG
ncbi:MAG: hypothetical protein Q9170_008311, partial [Blastenia crenularia]